MAECNMARVVKEGHLCLLDVRDTGFKKNKYWVELSTTPQEHVYRLCLYYDRFPREPWRLFPLEPNTFCGSECGKLNKRDHAEERYWALVLTTGTLLFQEGRGTRKKPAGHANSVELWDQEVRRCMRDRGRWMCQSVKSPDPPLPPEFIINLTEVSLSFTSHMANNRSARSHGRWDITHVAFDDPEYQNVKEDGQSFLKLIIGKPGKKKGIYMLKLPPQARLELVTKIRTLQSRCGPPTPPRPGLDDVQSRPLPDCPPPTVPRPPATLSPGSSPQSKPTQLSPGSSPHSKPTQLSPGASPHSKPTQLSPGASPHSKPTQLSPGASTHTPPSQLSPRLPPHSQPTQPLFGTSTHTQHTQLSHGPSPHTQPNQLSSRTSPSTPPTQLLPGASPALDVGSDTTDHSRSPSPTRRGRSPPFRKVGATSSQLKSLGKCPTPPLPKAQASPLVPTSGPHSKHFQRPGNEGKRQLPSPTETMSKSTNEQRYLQSEKSQDVTTTGCPPPLPQRPKSQPNERRRVLPRTPSPTQGDRSDRPRWRSYPGLPSTSGSMETSFPTASTPDIVVDEFQDALAATGKDAKNKRNWPTTQEKPLLPKKRAQRHKDKPRYKNIPDSFTTQSKDSTRSRTIHDKPTDPDVQYYSVVPVEKDSRAYYKNSDISCAQQSSDKHVYVNTPPPDSDRRRAYMKFWSNEGPTPTEHDERLLMVAGSVKRSGSVPLLTDLPDPSSCLTSYYNIPDLKADPFYHNPTLKGRKSTKCPPPPSEAPKDWLRKPIPAPRRATSIQELSADEHYEESPTVELCDQEQQTDNGQKKDIMSVLMDKTLEEDSLGLPKEKWEKMLLLLCFPSPLQNDWKDLASKLGLTNTDVMLLESVRENYKKLPARYVFRYWQKHRPLPYNRQEVQRVLVDLERLELAGMFDDYCRLPIKRVS
ncbi:hypothetical protein Bbelb_087580 [Branchiostoma belcheri]|nr:hypothetical protein Bbelb_087580 [Branchiostoma belcheri]